MGTGEVAGLLAAACWAVASLLYGRLPLSAWTMNVWKNVLATGVLLAHLAVVAWLDSTPVFSASDRAWFWMTISGLSGILLGDTLYFRSLQILGPRKALIVTTAAPVAAGVLAWAFLDETLSLQAVVGIAVTLGGILWVVSEQSRSEPPPHEFPGRPAVGIILGLLAAVCTGIGGVTARVGMGDDDCSELEGTFIRIAVSGFGGLIVLGFSGDILPSFREVAGRNVLKSLGPAVLCGTWLGIWFSLFAWKHSDAAVAATLLATSPLFVIPLVVVFLRERISFRAVVGTVIAIGGIVIMVS